MIPPLVTGAVVVEDLRRLDGLDGLKRLFWSRLGYDRVAASLSRRGWNATATGALVDDPVLLATAGEDQAFHVIFCHLATDRLLLSAERPVVVSLLRDHPYCLFVFANRSTSEWHFVNVRYDDETAQRQLFRRITVAGSERLRTASERLSLLDVSADGLASASPLVIQQRHDQAFDVEPVQRDFFETFRAMYDMLTSEIANQTPQPGRAAQLLLDRLLFLYFVQKKGWLGGRPDYLHAHFQPYRSRPVATDYYSDIVQPLFLSISRSTGGRAAREIPFLNGGLFEEQESSEDGSDQGLTIPNQVFAELFDRLLERFNFTVTEDTPFDVEVAIDPEMLGKIFESMVLQREKDPNHDLRRFTGSYYTPRTVVHYMCQQALVHYLAELLPRPTAFDDRRLRMETLLRLPPANQLDETQVGDLRELVSELEATALRQALLDCRFCDPAVGSGAFPVGMLQAMVSTVAKLDLRTRGLASIKTANYEYDLKRRVIEDCLYGVDIQDQAIRLCELRLWLSLIVDYAVDAELPAEEAMRTIPALPNLAFRVVRGDSLLERMLGYTVDLDALVSEPAARQVAEALQADKQSYFTEADTGEKRKLEAKILGKQVELLEHLVSAKHRAVSAFQPNLFGEAALRPGERRRLQRHETEMAELVEISHRVETIRAQVQAELGEGRTPGMDFEALRQRLFRTGDNPSFVWRLDFAEVFEEKGGFDIVIANPPYVSAIEFRRSYEDAYREELTNKYRSASGAYDLFVPFFEQGLRILRVGGILTYISPNKYLAAQYAVGLRELIRESSSIRAVVDLAAIRIFRDAAVYPLITILQKGEYPDGHVESMLPDRGDMVDFDPTHFTAMSFPESLLDDLPEKIWGFLLSREAALLPNLMRDTAPLESHLNINALTTASEAATFGALLSEQPTGDSVRVVNTGTIDPFRSLWGAHPMRDSGNRWVTPYLPLRSVNARRVTMYRAPKIIVAKIGRRCEAFLDAGGEYAGLNVNALYGADRDVTLEYVCAFLNSAVCAFVYTQFFGALRMGGGYLQFQAPQLRVLPIRVAPHEAQLQIKQLVREFMAISSPTRPQAENLRDRLDAIFYDFYELSPAERELIAGAVQ